MPDPRHLFVVHGRDDQARTAFWRFLHALDLRPLEWEENVRQVGVATPFLGEVVARAFDDVQAVVVLLTPDDVAYLHPELHGGNEPGYETAPTGQPRPNVLFEAGMALALQPLRTIVVEVGHLRPWSDIGGRNVIRFDGTPHGMPGKLRQLVERLRLAGCAVNDSGSDWLDLSRFADLGAYRRRP